MDEFKQIVAALVLLANAAGAIFAAYHAAKARTALEQHAVNAEGKDRVIADLTTIAGMEPEIAATVTPLIDAVKAAAAQTKVQQ